jgi:hypothetical protein
MTFDDDSDDSDDDAAVVHGKRRRGSCASVSAGKADADASWQEVFCAVVLRAATAAVGNDPVVGISASSTVEDWDLMFSDADAVECGLQALLSATDVPDQFQSLLALACVGIAFRVPCPWRVLEVVCGCTHQARNLLLGIVTTWFAAVSASCCMSAQVHLRSLVFDATVCPRSRCLAMLAYMSSCCKEDFVDFFCAVSSVLDPAVDPAADPAAGQHLLTRMCAHACNQRALDIVACAGQCEAALPTLCCMARHVSHLECLQLFSRLSITDARWQVCAKTSIVSDLIREYMALCCRAQQELDGFLRRCAYQHVVVLEALVEVRARERCKEVIDRIAVDNKLAFLELFQVLARQVRPTSLDFSVLVRVMKVVLKSSPEFARFVQDKDTTEDDMVSLLSMCRACTMGRSVQFVVMDMVFFVYTSSSESTPCRISEEAAGFLVRMVSKQPSKKDAKLERALRLLTSQTVDAIVDCFCNATKFARFYMALDELSRSTASDCVRLRAGLLLGVIMPAREVIVKEVLSLVPRLSSACAAHAALEPCIVCRVDEDRENMIFTPCFHLYHATCLQACLMSPLGDSCPLCKTPVMDTVWQTLRECTK